MKRGGGPGTRRSFILIEILVWLVLMAAVMLLMAEMMLSGLRIAKQAGERDALLGRVDAALDMMRRDAWRAEAIEAIDNQAAFLVPEGVILWRMEGGNTLTRLNPADAAVKKAWNHMPALRFRASGPLLRVEAEAGSNGRRESAVLVSQRMLAGGAP
jgi:type II secretory pathway pseudopilin PulG